MEDSDELFPKELHKTANLRQSARNCKQETLPKSLKSWKLFPNGLFGNNVIYSPLAIHYRAYSYSAVRVCCDMHRRSVSVKPLENKHICSKFFFFIET